MGNLCPKKKHEEPLVPSEKIPEPENNHSKISENDFTKIKLIGKGSYGNVFLVRYNKNNMIYAMKVYKKSDLREKKQENNTKAERNLLTQINFPFIVEVKFAFQTDSKLFLVQEFIQGGDLFFHIHSGQKFSTQKTKFYLVEIILAIDFLHKNNMIYRDLKPENILIDSKGHIKLTDFGLSKILKENEDKAFTICGTPQYLAPEVLKNKDIGYDKSVDWWSLGCLFYEMLTGFLPFYIPRNNKIDLRVFEQEVNFPPNLNPLAVDFIKELLNLDPNKRLGSGEDGINKIKNHAYFKDINWDNYYNKEIKPPFIPQLDDEVDLKYFDKMFTEEPVNSNRSTIHSRPREYSTYKGFTFMANSVKKELEDDNLEVNKSDEF